MHAALRPDAADAELRAAVDPLSASKKELGDRAERAAEEFLRARGFVILERKLHVGRFEIDLLARDGALVVVVEVRTRGAGSFERAFASVNDKKRARLVAAGERLWRERFHDDVTVERLRFDVIGVRFDGDRAEVEHVPGAFTG